jgi:hypothetical protein
VLILAPTKSTRTTDNKTNNVIGLLLRGLDFLLTVAFTTVASCKGNMAPESEASTADVVLKIQWRQPASDVGRFGNMQHSEAVTVMFVPKGRNIKRLPREFGD